MTAPSPTTGTSLGGVIIATALPYVEDPAAPAGLRVDLERYAEHCRWLIASGCDGVGANGSLGEYASLTDEERRAVAETAVWAVGDSGVVVVGVHAPGSHQARMWTEHARDIGADAPGRSATRCGRSGGGSAAAASPAAAFLWAERYFLWKSSTRLRFGKGGRAWGLAPCCLIFTPQPAVAGSSIRPIRLKRPRPSAELSPPTAISRLWAMSPSMGMLARARTPVESAPHSSMGLPTRMR
jgi:hypothetical protein